MADQSFPVTLTFNRDPTTITFESPEQVEKWLSDEQSFWSRVGDTPNDQFGQIIASNSRLLADNALKNKEVLTRLDALTRLAGQYIPSASGIGRIVDGLRQRGNQQGARVALGWFIAPQQIAWVNNPIIIEGAIAAIAYHSLGSGRIAEEEYKSATSEVEALRAQHLPAIEQLRKFFIAVEDDWKKKIEGFETRTALGAPRQYWKARADEHRRLAKSAMRSWNGWLLALVILASVCGLLIFSNAGPFLVGALEGLAHIPEQASTGISATDVTVVADIVRRALIFGSLLAICVWWLRQKLRDLRSHEHLAEDAAERVTMIETYSAMKGQGLSGNELALVLAALYRPAATGMVEDTGPSLPFETLMRAASETLQRR